jgi:glycosyltransferase involved in cell wall biosynthesis
MRIAIITREFPHLTPWGGMANFYMQMAEALRHLGHRVEVFAQGFHREYTEIVNGITVHRIQARHRGAYLAGMNGDGVRFHRFCAGLAAELAVRFERRHREFPFDVVEAHDHLGVSAALPQLDVPLFLTGHTSLTVFTSIPECRVRINGPLPPITELEYRAHCRADRIRFLSRDLLDRTCALFPGIRDKSTVVFNPCKVPHRVSMAAFDACPRDFLFVGRLEPRKGVQFIPDAVTALLAEYPDLRVTLLGQDCFYADQHMMMSEWMKQRLGPEAVRLTFLGWRPKADVERHLEQIPHVIVPSVYDNSAFAAQEGMAFGRCVLSSDAGGTKEYVADSGIIFPAGSASALAGAMRAALAQPDRARSLAVAAHARARQLFERTRFANQFVAEALDCKPIR